MNPEKKLFGQCDIWKGKMLKWVDINSKILEWVDFGGKKTNVW